MGRGADQEPPIEMRVRRGYRPWFAAPELDIELSALRERMRPLVTERWLHDATGARHSIRRFTSGPRPLEGKATYKWTITVTTAAHSVPFGATDPRLCQA